LTQDLLTDLIERFRKNAIVLFNGGFDEHVLDLVEVTVKYGVTFRVTVLGLSPLLLIENLVQLWKRQLLIREHDECRLGFGSKLLQLERCVFE
jgi:hypothetical protein